MKRRRKASTRRRVSRVGRKANGQIKSGYCLNCSGRVVRAKAKRRATSRRRARRTGR